MKRNWNVILDLLEDLESLEAEAGSWYPTSDEATGAELKEHVRLAMDAGFVEADIKTALGGEWVVFKPRLTNSGHDFLDGLRTEDRRERFFAWARKAGKDVTIQLALWYLSNLTD